jgi:hypothetical protein
MNSQQKTILHLEKENNTGGIDDVPSTNCLLSAYAESIGRTVTNQLEDMRLIQQSIKNRSVLFLEFAL